MKKFAYLCLGALSMLGGASLCAEETPTEVDQEKSVKLPQGSVADASTETNVSEQPSAAAQ